MPYPTPSSKNASIRNNPPPSPDLPTVKHFSIIALSIVLASCANDSGSTASQPTGQRPLSERLSGDRGYQQDAEGNWISKASKRSQYDSYGDSPNFKGDYKTGQYKAGEYAKKSWWKPNEVQRQSFDNRADGSRFQQASRLQGQGARESGSNAGLAKNYNTGGYATGTAREAGAANIDRPSDAETDFRRRVFPQPDQNLGWREQRQLTLGETKGLTGR